MLHMQSKDIKVGYQLLGNDFNIGAHMDLVKGTSVSGSIMRDVESGNRVIASESENGIELETLGASVLFPFYKCSYKNVVDIIAPEALRLFPFEEVAIEKVNDDVVHLRFHNPLENFSSERLAKQATYLLNESSQCNIIEASFIPNNLNIAGNLRVGYFKRADGAVFEHLGDREWISIFSFLKTRRNGEQYRSRVSLHRWQREYWKSLLVKVLGVPLDPNSTILLQTLKEFSKMEA